MKISEMVKLTLEAKQFYINKLLSLKKDAERKRRQEAQNAQGPDHEYDTDNDKIEYNKATQIEKDIIDKRNHPNALRERNMGIKLKNKLQDRKEAFNNNKKAKKKKIIMGTLGAVTTVPSLPFIKNKIMEYPKTAVLGLTAGALATAYKIHKRNQIKKQEKDIQDQNQIRFVQREKEYAITKDRINKRVQEQQKN